MATRLGWVIEGLRTGIVTTKYPAHPDPNATAGVRVWPLVHANRCHADDGCDACVRACLPGALTLLPDSAEAQACNGVTPGGQPNITLALDLGKCIGCGLCAQVCPHEAITMATDVELATRDADALRQFFSLSSAPAAPATDELR
jgi:formate hydrogenlyase subunit 6/NADH:ubiquinone oxidoreductase subunit I